MPAAAASRTALSKRVWSTWMSMWPTFEVVASCGASSANTGETEATPANPAKEANATDLRLMCFINNEYTTDTHTKARGIWVQIRKTPISWGHHASLVVIIF